MNRKPNSQKSWLPWIEKCLKNLFALIVTMRENLKLITKERLAIVILGCLCLLIPGL